jgi:multiple sugar transport system substrate-binding protein
MIVAMLLSLVACGGAAPTTTAQASTATSGGETTTAAATGSFDWKQQSGKSLRVMLNQHPYAEAIIKKLPDFEAKTGIKVEYSLTPEENYFDKVTTALNSKSGDPDIFMTGAYQVWEYAPAGYIEDLSAYINDATKTSPDYDFADFYPGVVGSLQWDLVAGHKTGSGPQWALPLGFEMYTLAYNKRILMKKA